MENKVEKIMKNYKKELDKIDKKYEVEQVKKPNTKELEEKIKYEKEFIAKLKFEGEELNKKMIAEAKERLEKAINEKEEIDSKYNDELLKRDENVLEKKQLKNSKVVLESGREVTMAEKDKMDKADLKDKAIKELTSESKAISEALVAKKAELENKRKEWNEFKYEYEEDENGKINPEPINAAEVKKIHAEFDNIKKEMSELDKMQKQCDKYLEELKAPTKEMEAFSKAWNESSKDSQQNEPTQNEPAQNEPAQNKPEQNQPAQNEPAQNEPAQNKPAQNQPEQNEPTQNEPAQNEPAQNKPEQNQPAQNEPAQNEPAQNKPAQNQPEQNEPAQNEPEQNKPEQNEPAQNEPTQNQPTQNEPVQNKPAQNQSQDIYSSSQDKVTSISINAAAGKAYITTIRQKNKEIGIEEAIETRKELFKRLDIKEMLEGLGVDSKIKQFMIRRRINPVILKAIQDDNELTGEYIESLIDNKKFPFKYAHNLENSGLSNKNTNFMNRIALKESKIEGNDVKGVEKLRTIKSFFRGIKNRAQKRFEKKEEPKQLQEGQVEKREKLSDVLQRQMKEQEKKYEEAYNNKLTDEQKANLENMTISDLQKLGIDYTTACGVKSMYAKENNENEKSVANKNEKSTEENEETK